MYVVWYGIDEESVALLLVLVLLMLLFVLLVMLCRIFVLGGSSRLQTSADMTSFLTGCFYGVLTFMTIFGDSFGFVLTSIWAKIAKKPNLGCRLTPCTKPTVGCGSLSPLLASASSFHFHIHQGHELPPSRQQPTINRTHKHRRPPTNQRHIHAHTIFLQGRKTW